MIGLSRRREQPGTPSSPRLSVVAADQLDLWRGAKPWTQFKVALAERLARVVAPEPLEETLQSLLDNDRITGFEIVGGVVYLEGDRVALELATMRLDEADRPTLGDDVERGFQESSGVYGEITRGGTTARAADFESVRTYYAEASAFLERDRTMTAKARRIWTLHADGESERTIAEREGISVRQVRNHLEELRRMAGLSRRKTT